MKNIMNKGVIYIFLLGIILGIGGYFAAHYYIEEQREIELKKLNLITSVNDFVSRIEFYDGEGVTMKEADMFYYNYTESKVSNVFMFSAREFYSLYSNDQTILAERISMFLKTKKLKGVTFSNKVVDPKMKTHNALHKWDGDYDNTFFKLKLSLEEKLKKARISEDDLKTLRYIYSLEGEYIAAERIDRKICQKSSKPCGQTEDLVVRGIITDPAGEPIEKVTIMALNYPSQKNTYTGSDGKFELKLKVNALDKIRLRAVKRGLSDGYKDFYIYHPDGATLEENPIQREMNFVLNRSHAILVLDLDTHIITFKQKGITKSANFKDNRFHVRTTNNAYHIPKDGFVDMKGRLYKEGKVELHLYEFDRRTEHDMNDLVRLDVSSENGERMFLGGFLLTFGMPYLQFFTEEGQELFISSKNPIELTYQIVEMEEMKTRETNPVLEEDLEKLVQYSKDLGGYPITREFLIEKELYHMPPWWMLNRKKGIWENVPFRLINTDGVLESVFYSYKS